MAQAARDQNRVTTLLGVSSADLTTPTLLAVDPVTNALLVENTASTAVIGGISLGGSNEQWKDDTFYGEDVTSGIGSVALRLWDGAAYDRLPGNSTDGLTATLKRSDTATVTSVNDTATSTTLLSANASRRGATIYNTSTAILYVKLGTTASATSFTVAMVASSYYEVPFGYTGRIDGIWASDQSGAAVITELT